MTFGRMSQDNEISAVRASGVNPLRLMLPPAIASACLGGLLVLFNNYVLPETNHAFANLLLDINRKKPSLELKEGVFLNDLEGYSMLIGRLDDRSGLMADVTIYDTTEGDTPRTILAHEGRFSIDPAGDRLVLDLRDGEIHEVPREGGAAGYRRLKFETYALVIEGIDSRLTRSERTTRGQREMSTAALRGEIARLRGQQVEKEAQLAERLQASGFPDYRAFEESLPRPETRGLLGAVRRIAGGVLARLRGERGAEELATPPEARVREIQMIHLEVDSMGRQINQFRVEIDKKFSIPFACVVFVLVGAPLGIRSRRGGVTVGFLSVAFFIVYYLFLVGGEQLADRGLMPPTLSMWAANLVLGGLGAYLTLRASEFRPPRRREAR
jgi:lipopolysaccharide export system permease protein